MTEEARRARNAYRRAWAKAHPDKVKAWQEHYWEKKARQLEQEQTPPAEEEKQE